MTQEENLPSHLILSISPMRVGGTNLDILNQICLAKQAHDQFKRKESSKDVATEFGM